LIVEKDQKNDKLKKKLQKYEKSKENLVKKEELLKMKEVMLKRGEQIQAKIKKEYELSRVDTPIPSIGSNEENSQTAGMSSITVTSPMTPL